jgi:hypothetical protein
MTVLAKLRWFIPVPHGTELAIVFIVQAFHQSIIEDAPEVQFFRKRLGTARCCISIP